MTRPLEIETLMAYVDGELDETEARALELRMARDEVVRKTVDELREGSTLLRVAFDEALREAPADELRAAVAATFDAHAHSRFAAEPARRRAGRPVGGRRTLVALTALAACVAGIGIGVFGGYQVAETRFAHELASLEAERLADRQRMDQVVSRVLEETVSGSSVSWRDPESAAESVITPVRTFRSAEGRWCREYVRRTVGGAASPADPIRAIACREGERFWRTRMQLAVDS